MVDDGQNPVVCRCMACSAHVTCCTAGMLLNVSHLHTSPIFQQVLKRGGVVLRDAWIPEMPFGCPLTSRLFISAPYIAKVAALPADKTCRGTALGTQPGEINPATRYLLMILIVSTHTHMYTSDSAPSVHENRHCCKRVHMGHRANFTCRTHSEVSFSDQFHIPPQALQHCTPME